MSTVPRPAFLAQETSISYCSATNGWYSCSSPHCKHKRPCASDAGLLHCSCSEMGRDERRQLFGASADALSVFPFPCFKTDVRLRDPLSRWEECDEYNRLPLDRPVSSGCGIGWIPRVLHGVGNGAPSFSFRQNAAANPSFRSHFLDDASAREYVSRHCGADAALAYDCFAPPAYRADLARFCFLFAEGGVYVDADMVLLRPIEAVVSLCAEATLGYDFPQSGLSKDNFSKGMQMKILASRPGHPLFRCMLNRIIRHARTRFMSLRPLDITGPALLHSCYQMIKRRQNTTTVHVTYRDSRGAMWPYSGMMGKSGLLAFENPKPYDYASGDIEEDDRNGTPAAALHYHEMVKRGVVYRDSCAL